LGLIVFSILGILGIIVFPIFDVIF
jgi:hypothetical protein